MHHKKIVAMTLVALVAFAVCSAQVEEETIKEARRLASDGKLNEAVALLNEAVKRQEHIWNAHLLKLETLKLYHNAGKIEERINTMRTALTQRPYDAELLWSLAQAYWLSGDMWNALCYLTRAIGVAPTVGAYYAWLGKAYMELGMQYHAEAAFELALRYDPTLLPVVNQLRRPPVVVKRPEIQPPIQTQEPQKPPEQLPQKPQEQPKPIQPPQQEPTQPTQKEVKPQPPAQPPQPQRIYRAEIAPNGSIARFSVKGQLCFINFGFRVAPPGWGWPPMFRQVDLSAGNVKREEQDGQITITGQATSNGSSIKWAQTITQTDDGVTVSYELTPLDDIKMESVLIEAWIPNPVVAEGQWFTVVGGRMQLKPFPEKPPQGPSPVFFTSNTLEPVGWITKAGVGVLFEIEKVPNAFWWLQDDRTYGLNFFELQIHSGLRNVWRKGQTVEFVLTLKPIVSEAQQQ
ncbi:MAG: hypothetical protein RUDDFDWM_001706 [Candidatus Fervidibacterota bacterium]